MNVLFGPSACKHIAHRAGNPPGCTARRYSVVRGSEAFNPFPSRGSVHARIGAVRTPSGRRERPRGRTDPPDGSPGPPEQKNGGHHRAQGPIWPSSVPAGAIGDARPTASHGHVQPVNHVVSLASLAATLACASFHMTEHTCKRFLDSSEAFLAQTSSAS